MPETRSIVRRRAAFAVLAVAPVLLTACAGPSATDTAFNAWYDQMQIVLGDTNGSGGGGGATPGSVELGTMRTGTWVVYAVCNDTDGWWSAQVNSTSWKQDESFSFN